MDRNTIYFKTSRGGEGVWGSGIENILSSYRSQKKTPQKKTKKGYKEETQSKILELNPHINNHEKYILILISY